MERQSVTPDKKSGIVNDAKLWATETMGNAKCPLDFPPYPLRGHLECPTFSSADIRLV